MKRVITIAVLLLSLSTFAQENKDTLFLEMTDNTMLIIPKKYIEKQASTNTSISFELKGDTTITISKSKLKNQYTTADYPYERPVFLSYKFNDKFNDQLFSESDTVDIDEINHVIRMQVGGIGKRLTPSFKLPEGAYAYVNGVRQYSKETRLRFDKPIHYTVAYPNQTIYKLVKKDDTKYDDEWASTKVNLTTDMFSTNAPSNNGEDPDKLIDGDINTFFHSTWNSGTNRTLKWYDGAYYGDGISEWPYLQIDLTNPIYNFSFSYITRSDMGDRAPLGLILQGSNDGSRWTDIRTFTQESDNLPTETSATYTSPIITLKQGYKSLRLQLTAAQHKNYLVLSEFSLYRMEKKGVSSKLWDATKMGMSKSLLSSDKASDNELAQLIDCTPYTACELNYNSSTQKWPYIQVKVPNPTYNLQFIYTTVLKDGDINNDGKVTIADVTDLVNIILGKTTKEDTSTADVNSDGKVTIADVTDLVNIILGKSAKGAYAPTAFTLQGSTDGKSWTTLKTFTADNDGLPTAQGTSFTSPIITTDTKYTYLRLQPTSGQDGSVIMIGELEIYDVASSQPSLQPYGTEYDVQVDFLTDLSTSAYNVPRIDIWFGDRQTWGPNMWIGRNGKEFYEEATIRIDGAGVYPDMQETAMLIRGRGNTSWSSSYSSKNPYRLKFSSKVKPFGMTKGKSWVLLANKQSNSMTTNALAMKIADMVESRGCNHIVPCELYINGQYRGSYNFTEKVGFSNNSIELDDETNAVMLELDQYYDEAYKFRDNNYNLYVNVKEPDFIEALNEGTLTNNEVSAKFSLIQSVFNNFTANTKRGGTTYLDVDAFVRAMLVNDLVRNEECKHPKSWYLYNPDITNSDSLWTFGPVWDFDWSYGYEGTSTYFIRNAEIDLFTNMGSNDIGYPFFRDLLRSSETVKRAYYRLWTDFMESGKLDELIEYCDDYFNFVNPSLKHNALPWSDGNNYATTTTNAKNWLKARAKYIYSHLDAYDLNEDIINVKEEFPELMNRVDVGEIVGELVNVYSLNGVMIRHQVPYAQCFDGLAPGIYIVNGKKIIVNR